MPSFAKFICLVLLRREPICPRTPLISNGKFPDFIWPHDEALRVAHSPDDDDPPIAHQTIQTFDAKWDGAALRKCLDLNASVMAACVIDYKIDAPCVPRRRHYVP